MKTPYTLSKDYNLLYELVKDGNEIPCWVHYARMDTIDICRCRIPYGKQIDFGVRGHVYGGVDEDAPKYFNITEKELFIKECEMLQVEFILP